jgi:pilus assembly protein CpaD
MNKRPDSVRKVPSMKPASLALTAALGLALAGCVKSDYQPTGSLNESSDHTVRHPIVIDSVPKSVSIYPMRGPGGLDRRQREDLRALAEEYRTRGRGHLVIKMPSNAGRDQSQTLSYIRKALHEEGIPGAYLQTGHYEPMHPTAASPVKVEFSILKAKVASECGKWPADAIDGSTSAGFDNRPFHNFGCSTQSILAAQVADPADLARPREMGEGDLGKRTDDITQLRGDADPSTKWANNANSVGQ